MATTQFMRQGSRPRLPPSSTNSVCSAAVQRALQLLGRASAEWRNGDADLVGELHWPVSVNLARRALREALEALEPVCWQPPSVDEDARAGIAWFNGLSPAERRYWLEEANSAVPADAWSCYKAGVSVPA